MEYDINKGYIPDATDISKAEERERRQAESERRFFSSPDPNHIAESCGRLPVESVDDFLRELPEDSLKPPEKDEPTPEPDPEPQQSVADGTSFHSKVGDVSPTFHKEGLGEMVKRLVEENQPKRKSVTAKQYQQATKLQVGSEIFEMGLDNTTLIIWFYLSKCADKNSRECFPSITDISRKCKCRRSKAIRGVEILEEKKIIRSVKQHHRPTIYIMRPPEDWSNLTISL